ncbi:MAG: putative N-ethylmaleimide reductase [Sphingomonadales bacterium]|nr:putative N-ethylmaleimide reductase [Sphingomonadales bacterium]
MVADQRHLFTPVGIGPLLLPNRIVMAPMTRSRAAQPGDVPTALMATHYAQRAGAGLIVTEASQISPEGKGYSGTPGIYSPAQRDGWTLTTDAVHAAGGHIFLQIWHVGRVSHVSLQPDNRPPVSASAIAAHDTKVYIVDDQGVAGFVPCSPPRALDIAEIPRVVDDFRRAAALAIEAGFDGVEIHGANGYLIEQFLRSNSNRRDDAYGGSAEGRVRFLDEVASAVASEIGADRVGVRLSPFITFKDMDDPEILETIGLALDRLDAIGIAYVHLSEADWDDAPAIPESARIDYRRRFRNRLIVAGRYTAERAEAVIASGHADLVAFGRPFIANPDLPHRLSIGAPLAAYDMATLFGGDERGYIDYPALDAD